MGKFNQQLMQHTKNCASDNYDIKDISPQPAESVPASTSSPTNTSV
jgi:hypothetical protein